MSSYRQKRYAQVGLGGRSILYTDGICKFFSKHAALVALCDNNTGRLDLCNQRIAKLFNLPPIPAYGEKQFDRMLKEQKPDVVIVTTKDCVHDHYIIRAMELGCDVITEKPMTIDEKRCRKILDAIKRTKRNLRVTFNYRYSPPRTQVKELLMKGAIGKVLSVEFQWLLNTSHGADYFRRWHREKANSGGLMTHKATHHFDLVNWWLSAEPEEVFAMGARRFYGSQSGMAERYGLHGRSERCAVCKVAKKCPFHLDMSKYPTMRTLYLDCEKYDNYFRDRCVFGKTMDIEDTMNLTVRYNTGAIMSYALNAFTPWEGYHVCFNGTRGRLEHHCVESVYISGDDRVQGTAIPKGTSIVLYPHFKPARAIPLRAAKGGHGGGDFPLLQSLFLPRTPPDPCRRAAGVAAGAYSILTGIAANRSMKTNKPVRIRDLVRDIPPMDHTPMRDV